MSAPSPGSTRPPEGAQEKVGAARRSVESDTRPLRALIVDDEALARQRMRTLLGECSSPKVHVEGEAANATQAQALLEKQGFDVVLLDIHMPGTDGLSLARVVRAMRNPPAIVFVTAHTQHAVQAFDLDVVDYLTKPVRLSRLMVALQKVRRQIQQAPTAPHAPDGFLTIVDRGRLERVAMVEVLYLKAELKYITVRTAARSYILDASLSELEDKYGQHFVRVHRNALVARRMVRALEKHDDEEEGEGWAVRLHGVDDVVAISRRQLPALRELISSNA